MSNGGRAALDPAAALRDRIGTRGRADVLRGARRRRRARGIALRGRPRRGLKHGSEKCEAVFREDHAQTGS
ncbi:hypothetical protein T4C_6619 [Trichinella pseudospiralis]|uniref:Uncharacterized protein n=1 Tax=Trichinella pseudospiralis TaxID=6337 RepID=A0A0V1GKJ1_TRIPS|nr:hypothetical protein T4C_6619 [Trichinella pseudospiralis]